MCNQAQTQKKLLLPHWDGPGELCWTPLSASTPKISSADPPKELLSLHPDSLLHEDVSPSWTSSSSQGKATWQPPCCFALRVRVTLAAGKIRTLPCAGSLLLKNLPQLFVGKAQHSLARTQGLSGPVPTVPSAGLFTQIPHISGDQCWIHVSVVIPHWGFFESPW